MPFKQSQAIVVRYYTKSSSVAFEPTRFRTTTINFELCTFFSMFSAFRPFSLHCLQESNAVRNHVNYLGVVIGTDHNRITGCNRMTTRRNSCMYLERQKSLRAMYRHPSPSMTTMNARLLKIAFHTSNVTRSASRLARALPS